MSRLGWTVVIIGVVLAILVGVLAVMPRDLGYGAKSSIRRATEALKKAEALHKSRQQQVDALVVENKAFYAKRPELRSVRLDLERRAKLLKQGRAYKDKLDALAKRNKSSDSSNVYYLAAKVSKATRDAAADYEKVARPLKEVARYKKNEAKLAAQAAADASRAKRIPSARAIAAVKAAKKTHPKLARALDSRLVRCERLRRRVGRSYAQLRQARAVDPVASGKLAEAIHDRCEALQKAEQDLLADIDDIDHDVDRILVDMKTSGPQRFHSYKVIRGQTVTKTGWQKVSIPFHLKHMPSLGLAISSKPAGMLSSQASPVAAPPGYNYINRPGYGAWRSAAGSVTTPSTAAGSTAAASVSTAEKMRQVWHFDERYAYMPKLFWGASYKPVTYRDYLRYKLAGTAKRPYYGPRNQYGTSGSWTRRHYASSACLIALAAAAASRRRYSTSYGGSYGSRRYGSRRYGSNYGRTSYGGWGK